LRRNVFRGAGGLGPRPVNFEVKRAFFLDIIWYLGHLGDTKKIVMILIYILTYNIYIADVEN